MTTLWKKKKRRKEAVKETTEIAMTIILQWIMKPLDPSKVSYFHGVKHVSQQQWSASADQNISIWQNLYETWEYVLGLHA